MNRSKQATNAKLRETLQRIAITKTIHLDPVQLLFKQRQLYANQLLNSGDNINEDILKMIYSINSELRKYFALNI